MYTAAAPAAGSGGGSLRRVQLLRSARDELLGQARLLTQLAWIEGQEEKRRLLRMLGIGLLGFACLLCMILFASALLLVAAWDTSLRLPAIAGLVVLHGVGTAIAWRRLQAWSTLGDQAFAATRTEMAAGAALLKACL